MLKKAILLMMMLFICSGLVFAVDGVTQIDNFYNENGVPLTGVQSELYTSGSHSQVHSLNSGGSNSISFEYPYNPDSTEQNTDSYDHFMFKECYLPLEYKEEIWGYGATLEYDDHFEKAQSCHSPIDSFSVTNDNHPNEPIVVDVSTTLEGDAHSAFTDKELTWFPSGYEDYYSVETEVTVEILHDGDVVHTETKTADILMDTSENVQFTWTPQQEGYFTARIKTDVVDCQCQSGQEQQSSKEFEVWAERPFDECYTLIQNLEAVPEFPVEGDNVVVSFDKISNYADTNYDKTPLATNVDYTITNSNNQVVDQGSFNIEANSNGQDYESYSFDWNPETSGDYNIKVEGVADSNMCTDKNNPVDTANLGVVVDGIETYELSFVVENSENGESIEGASVLAGALDGVTDSTGTVSFEMNPGSYNWDVSAEGFASESGSVDISGHDETVNVALDPVGEDSFSVTFDVEDASTDFGVEDAQVEFGALSGVTDSDGRIVFNDVQAGAFAWDVSAEGYEAASGNVDIQQNEQIDVSLQPVQPVQCTPGDTETRQCGETDVGVCEYGVQERTCDTEGFWNPWGDCQGAVGPSEEICDNLDNDCDGEVDEGGVCAVCTPGDTETRQCGETDVGVCEYGVQERTCDTEGFWNPWGDCQGAVYPSEELGDGLDNDCDGEVDEGLNFGPIMDEPDLQRHSIFIDDVDFVNPTGTMLVPGDMMDLRMNLKNNGDFDLENVELKALVHDFGSRAEAGPFDLDVGDKASRTLHLYVPQGVENGDYPVRLTMSNDKVKRVVYRYVTIS